MVWRFINQPLVLSVGKFPLYWFKCQLISVQACEPLCKWWHEAIAKHITTIVPHFHNKLRCFVSEDTGRLHAIVFPSLGLATHAAYCSDNTIDLHVCVLVDTAFESAAEAAFNSTTPLTPTFNPYANDVFFLHGELALQLHVSAVDQDCSDKTRHACISHLAATWSWLAGRHI